jgi:hypothetical protein
MLRPQLAGVTKEVLSGLYALWVEDSLGAGRDEVEGDSILETFWSILATDDRLRLGAVDVDKWWSRPFDMLGLEELFAAGVTETRLEQMREAGAQGGANRLE